jgi:hypothetical protein
LSRFKCEIRFNASSKSFRACSSSFLKMNSLLNNVTRNLKISNASITLNCTTIVIAVDDDEDELNNEMHKNAMRTKWLTNWFLYEQSAKYKLAVSNSALVDNVTFVTLLGELVEVDGLFLSLICSDFESKSKRLEWSFRFWRTSDLRRLESSALVADCVLVDEL